jgi:hypothetical protein
VGEIGVNPPLQISPILTEKCLIHGILSWGWAGLWRLFVGGRNSGEPAPTDAPHSYPKIPFFQSHQTQTSICVYLRSSAVKISISWVGAGSPISVPPSRQARKPAPSPPKNANSWYLILG